VPNRALLHGRTNRLRRNKLERYPDHLGRTVLWVGASTLYGVCEHPEEEIGQIILSSWL
jgi:hypothetical protein